MANEETKKKPRFESFYDEKFSIEAMQHEPYENGFTWRAVLGAFFVAFVMLPGVIFMGLMIGQDLGTAADWVVIILFVELARRSFITLRKQELYMLRYTVSHLSHIAGGVALGGGIFAGLVYNRYLRNSEIFHNFGIAQDVPDWFAPYGDRAWEAFTDSVWWPVIGVTISAMLLSKLTQLSLGFLAYKITVDVEKLPFPLAPVRAEGAVALAERSREENKGGYRQYCFSIGVMMGAVFGIFYVAIPTLSQALLGQTIMILPIPFLDLTTTFENWFPSGTIGISLNLALILFGCVLPWRIVLGGFVTTMVVQLLVNPTLQRCGYIPQWRPGQDAIRTHISTTLDLYLSIGIGTAFAVFFVGLFGMVRSLIRYGRKKADDAEGVDIRALFRRDVERGDPPTWLAFLVWVVSAAGFVLLSDHLINTDAAGHRISSADQFSTWWLIFFAFFWTPVNTYINARMAGIAGQHAGVPFIFQSAIFISGYRFVNIWFAPLPLANYGQMATFLREVQLTRTKFTSILKAELLVFPLMMVASFLFWSYISSLGPIPSDNYPYVQKFWPQFATMKAVWASSMQEGGSMLLRSIKPLVIFAALGGTLLAFVFFNVFGISIQFLYGGIASLNSYPHMAVMTFAGACLGRFYLAKKFGRQPWQNYAPILAVGFMAGMGLTGMLSIAINFLWVSIGTGY